MDHEYRSLTHYVRQSGLSRRVLLHEIEYKRLRAVLATTAADGRRYYKISTHDWEAWEQQKYPKNALLDNGRKYGVLKSTIAQHPVDTVENVLARHRSAHQNQQRR